MQPDGWLFCLKTANFTVHLSRRWGLGCRVWGLGFRVLGFRVLCTPRDRLDGPHVRGCPAKAPSIAPSSATLPPGMPGFKPWLKGINHLCKSCCDLLCLLQPLTHSKSNHQIHALNLRHKAKRKEVQVDCPHPPLPSKASNFIKSASKLQGWVGG